LIGVDGQQLGVISLDEALRQAERAELDLVEVSPDANPPVCKIFDYGKYRFEQGKREKEAKKKQHVIQIKEIKFRPKIDTHDYETKRNHIHRFLTGGNKVKVTIMYRGREMDHIDIGRKILDNIIHELEQVSLVEAFPKLEGRNMVMTLAPKKS
jgi:translation initiation factor IF-3